MNDLSTLAERLEGATGSDPALDVLIACALHPEYADFEPSEQFPAGRTAQRLNCPGWTKNAPPYTESIDAALALVDAKLPPYGWSWRVQHTLGSERASIWREGLRSEWSISLTAPTAPLAILRALVAALAAQDKGA